jgi:predicted metal-dependent peptidase
MRLSITSEQKLEQARMRLVRVWPFFARFALEPEYVEDSSTETMATDGEKVFWSREYLDAQTTDVVTALSAHEGAHIAFGHHLRRGSRDAKLWNVACDHVVNILLADSNFQLWDGAIIDRRFADMTAEQVYALLAREKSQQEQQGQGQGQGQGQPAPSQPEPSQPGEVRDFPGDAAETATARAEQPGKLSQAVQMARKRGALPGSLGDAVARERAPRVPWREKLADWAQSLSTSDYSWQRPNRVYLSEHDIIMPSARSRTMGPLAVGIDTSGSISTAELESFAGELRSLHSQLRPEALHILYHDSKVYRADTFGPDDYVEFAQ